MDADPALAAQLLPDLSGWTSPEAPWLTRGEHGTLARRIYVRGRTEAGVELSAGASAAVVVAQQSQFPLDGEEAGRGGSRTWLLRGCPAHLVGTGRGGVHSLSVILRGGPGDLEGSVRLSVGGRRLRAADAEALALALDWDAIVAALGGPPPDPARIAAASCPPPTPPAGAATPVLWPMMPTIATMERLEWLQRRQPPRFSIANEAALWEAVYPLAAGVPGRDVTDQDPARFAAMPAPVLVITDRGFAPNYIWAGLHFASARMREALCLGPEAIEYRAVDDDGCVPAARAADYRMFRVVHQADPVDLVRMYGHEPDRDADGHPTVAWLLSVHGPHAPPRRTVWREGFVAPAPLFRDATGRLIATEALADRVARAGLADVAFQDVAGEMSLSGLSFRTVK
ncbi:MAG: hypothetical protein E7K72_00780 [Roseomonas mucosa]|nr:hypothetical protein [Roseomonas mucosa]